MDVRFSRHLRANSSYVEKVLWIRLRNRQFHGFKFRRQQPIGPFFADFICFEKKLILEVDGPHHEDQKEYDQRRDDWLRREGYQVLRIANEEFQINEVMAYKKILTALTSLTPPSPPRGEGE